MSASSATKRPWKEQKRTASQALLPDSFVHNWIRYAVAVLRIAVLREILVADKLREVVGIV
jgi:hypothetical protein